MSEIETQAAELPLDTTGVRLARAREAAGFSRAELAARTKIPERHLIAIEEGRFGDLPARMYAVGFSRTYAREVGLNEVDIANSVRAEIKGTEGEHDGRPAASSFEPGDPARVPPLGLALIALLAAVAVVLGGLLVWRSYWAPGVSLPSLAPADGASASPAASNAAPPMATAPAVATEAAAASEAAVVPAAAPQLSQASRQPQPRPRAERRPATSAPTSAPASAAGEVTPAAADTAPAQPSTVSE